MTQTDTCHQIVTNFPLGRKLVRICLTTNCIRRIIKPLLLISKVQLIQYWFTELLFFLSLLQLRTKPTQLTQRLGLSSNPTIFQHMTHYHYTFGFPDQKANESL